MEELVHVPGGVVGTLSPLILRTLGIEGFLGVDRVVPLLPGRRYDAIVGWGRKRNADWAARYARLTGTPFFRLEDGFLRSVGLGRDGDPPLSIVVDDLGIYYDATRPSRLETLLASEDPRLVDADLLARAAALRQEILREGLSKYNRATEEPPPCPPGRKRVLVVDQVAGDLSLRFGGANSRVSARMLRAAVAENAGAQVLVKAHPQGHLSALGTGAGSPAVELVPPTVNPIRLLQTVDRVYVMTSLLGFEALLCGAEVSVFGCPFYAGWGLTDDRTELPRRGRKRSVEQLLVGAYLLYSRAYLPDRGRCEIEQVAQWLAASR